MVQTKKGTKKLKVNSTAYNTSKKKINILSTCILENIHSTRIQHATQSGTATFNMSHIPGPQHSTCYTAQEHDLQNATQSNIATPNILRSPVERSSTGGDDNNSERNYATHNDTQVPCVACGRQLLEQIFTCDMCPVIQLCYGCANWGIHGHHGANIRIYNAATGQYSAAGITFNTESRAENNSNGNRHTPDDDGNTQEPYDPTQSQSNRQETETPAPRDPELTSFKIKDLHKITQSIIKFDSPDRQKRTFDAFKLQIEVLAEQAIPRNSRYKDKLKAQLLINRLGPNILVYLFENSSQTDRSSFNTICKKIRKQFSLVPISGALETDLLLIKQGSLKVQQIKTKIMSLSLAWIKKRHEESGRYGPDTSDRTAVLEDKRRAVFLTAINENLRQILLMQPGVQSMNFEEITEVADRVENCLDTIKNYRQLTKEDTE